MKIKYDDGVDTKKIWKRTHPVKTFFDDVLDQQRITESWKAKTCTRTVKAPVKGLICRNFILKSRWLNNFPKHLVHYSPLTRPNITLTVWALGWTHLNTQCHVAAVQWNVFMEVWDIKDLKGRKSKMVWSPNGMCLLDFILWSKAAVMRKAQNTFCSHPVKVSLGWTIFWLSSELTSPLVSLLFKWSFSRYCLVCVLNKLHCCFGAMTGSHRAPSKITSTN